MPYKKNGYMIFKRGKLVKNPMYGNKQDDDIADTLINIAPGYAIKGAGVETPEIDKMSVRQMKISPVPITTRNPMIQQNTNVEYKKDKILNLMNQALNFTGSGLKKINRL